MYMQARRDIVQHMGVRGFMEETTNKQIAESRDCHAALAAHTSDSQPLRTNAQEMRDN